MNAGISRELRQIMRKRTSRGLHGSRGFICAIRENPRLVPFRVIGAIRGYSLRQRIVKP
jgi:hypothetical protein